MSMDSVTPIINEVNTVVNFFSRVWGFFAPHVKYVLELEKNIGLLGKAMKELIQKRNDVKRKVEVEEMQGFTCTYQVKGWLETVEITEAEVKEIQAAFDRRTAFLEDCCPRNCCSTYKLGKRAVEKLAYVVELENKDVFNKVAEQSLPDPITEMPSTLAVGLDSTIENVRSYLGEDEVGVIAIYGMGGVGKTTLLKKINNEFLQRSHDFDVVIFVVVSENPNVGNIQKVIGEMLFTKKFEEPTGKKLDSPFCEDEDEAAAKIFKALTKKKFLVLLDDVWSELDLEKVGIPQPNRQNQSKLIFTTRNEAVCGTMKADKEICVQCLVWKEAWDLFKINVGQKAMNSHPEIPRLAEIVAKKCDGLPLALITIGKAMASHKTPEEWKHEIEVLSNSASNFPGLNDKLLLLRRSYENLASDALRSCFLYCCLYPEDYSIRKDELIDYWVVEGFLGEDDDLHKARYKGHFAIGRLKDAFLLEDGDDPVTEVKMHDIIRELALWISSEHKYFVRAGAGLTSAAKQLLRWKDATKISLMRNRLEALMVTPICLNLVTLMLQGNEALANVSSSFFKSMPLLRVLNLSKTRLRQFPIGISDLVELVHLNLSHTEIESLPGELVKLVKLTHLDLSHTSRLETIPNKVIAGLLSLQVLNLFNSLYKYWKVEGVNDNESKVDLVEFEGLEQLNDVGISIITNHTLNRFLRSRILPECTQYLEIIECFDFHSSSTFGNMKRLQNLHINNCDDMEELTIGAESDSQAEGENSFLPSLQNLSINYARKLKTIVVPCGCLQNLRFLCIYRCNELKNLTWVVNLWSLQQIDIYNCNRMEEVIGGEDEAGAQDLIALRRLEKITLRYLPKLRRICRYTLSFPSLQSIKVLKCPELHSLALGPRSANNTLLEIGGEREWWNCLEWEESIKLSFLPYFREIDMKVYSPPIWSSISF